MTSLLGYLESSFSHPSLWLGAYDADHPALSLHYKNSCGPAEDTKLECPDDRQALPDSHPNTVTTEIRERRNAVTPINEKPQTEHETKPTPQDTDKLDAENEAAKKDPAYSLFTPEQAKDLVEKTEERVKGLLATSPLLQNQKLETLVPTFTLGKDIRRGKQLGAGGFALIFNAKVKDPIRLLNHHQTEPNKENCEYVIKHLSPDLINQERKLHIGMRDFVMESYLMAKLDHPHILKLVGCSQGGIASFGTTLRTDGFFMVLPKLTCTLTEKLIAWKEDEEARRHLPKSLHEAGKKACTRSWSSGAILARQRILREAELKERQTESFYCRLQVVIDLLSALEYIHSKRLFHRDLKPDNIGLDTEGCVKLFDFGLAKQLPPDDEATNRDTCSNPEDYTFALPGNSGTARYMAPEVILRQPYNCKVDVFATSILCWEVLSMERAYVSTGVPAGQFFKDCVAIYNDRPPIPKKWPKALRKALKQGWIKELSARPTSAKMRQGLQKIVDDHRNGRSR